MRGNFLEIGGEFFAIDGEIDLEFYSPFIDAEELVVQGESINPRGNYIMPMELTGTPQLAKALHNPQLLQLRNRVSTITGVVLWSDGLRLDTGKFDIQQVPGNLNTREWKVNGQFYNDAAAYAEAVSDINLRQLTLCGEISILGRTIRELCTLMHDAYPNDFQDNSAFPIVNFNMKDFLYVRRGMDILQWVYDNIPSAQLQATHWYANMINEGDEPYDDETETATVTAPGLGYFVFPSYYGVWDGAETESLHSILNHYTYTGFMDELKPVGENWVKYTALRNQVVPMFFYHQVLRHCFSQFGYTLQGDLLEDEDFLKLILPNTYSILQEEVLRVENLFGTNDEDQDLLYCQPVAVINPKNHLPDWSVLDFLRDFMLKFNVYFDIKGSTVTIKGNTLHNPSNAYDRLSPKVISEPKKAQGATVKYKFETSDTSYDGQNNFKETISIAIVESVGSSIVASLTNGDKYLQNNFNGIRRKNTYATDQNEAVVNNLVPYVTGTDKTFESELTPVEMAELNYNTLNDPAGEEFVNSYLPYFGHNPTYYDISTVKIKWTSYSSGDNWDVFEIIGGAGWELNEGDSEKKIAFFHGMQKTLQSNTIGFSYPYMAFHNYAPRISGSDVKLGNWHLGWLGSEGLIAVHWREWINVFSGWKIIYELTLTWQHIRTHNWAGSDVIHSGKYYISSIKFKMPALLRKVHAIVEAFEL